MGERSCEHFSALHFLHLSLEWRRCRTGRSASLPRPRPCRIAPAMNTPVESLSFEDALKELEAIVAPAGNRRRDARRSIELYERGNLLRAALRRAARCGAGADRGDPARRRRPPRRHRARSRRVERAARSPAAGRRAGRYRRGRSMRVSTRCCPFPTMRAPTCTARCAMPRSAAASGCARCSSSPTAQLFAVDRDVARARRRLRDRGDPRLFADPRRSAGDGRRRSAPRQADRAQGVRRGDRDPGGRLPARAGVRSGSPIRTSHPDPFVRAELVLELARASGPAGMAGGQMMDLAAEDAPLRSGRRHAAAADEDRRADRRRRSRRARSWAASRRRGAPGCAAMPTTSASPSRSPTTCSTPRATRRRRASAAQGRRARARRRSCRCWASSGRASNAGCWSIRRSSTSTPSARRPTCCATSRACGGAGPMTDRRLSRHVRSHHARPYGHHPARREAGRPAGHRRHDQSVQVADVHRSRSGWRWSSARSRGSSGDIRVVVVQFAADGLRRARGRDRSSSAACARSPISNMNIRWRG